MQVQPYLMFDGRCEEALAFYAQALGAQTQLLMRFRDSPEPPAGECSASAAVPGDKVMHAELRVGETTLMASDGMAGGHPVFNGISLTLSVASEVEARSRFDALADAARWWRRWPRPSFRPRSAWSTTVLACRGWCWRTPRRAEGAGQVTRAGGPSLRELGPRTGRQVAHEKIAASAQPDCLCDGFCSKIGLPSFHAWAAVSRRRPLGKRPSVPT